MATCLCVCTSGKKEQSVIRTQILDNWVIDLIALLVSLKLHANCCRHTCIASCHGFGAWGCIVTSVHHNSPQFIIQDFSHKLQAFSIPQSSKIDTSDRLCQGNCCLGGRLTPSAYYSMVFPESSIVLGC